jgi:hypothetical protein
MSKKQIIIIYLIVLHLLIFTFCASAATFSGANVPFDSSFHLGLVSGPGTGINIGADVFYPMGEVSYGIDIEQQVTNSEMEQNINILKYGLALKYVISEDLYLTIHIGKSSFYLTKAIDYRDSLTGAEYSIDEDTHGNATYLAIAPNFRVGEYFLTPKIILNNIADGGTISEFDLNIGHKF